MKRCRFALWVFFIINTLLSAQNQISASYENLKSGGTVQIHQIEAINDYLKSSLISSPYVEIRLDETDLAIHGKISNIDSRYLIVVQLTDFGSNRELGSYTEDFLSLSEFKFVVNSIVAQIEGRSFIQEKSEPIQNLEIEDIGKVELQKVELEDLQLSDIAVLSSDLELSDDPNEEKMAKILNEELLHCYILFNDGSYTQTINETRSFINRFDNMYEDAKETFLGFRKNAEDLIGHSYQRIELNKIRDEVNQVVVAQGDALSNFNQLRLLLNQLDKDWFDQNEMSILQRDIRSGLTYFYASYLQSQIILLAEYINKGDYDSGFTFFDNLTVQYDSNQDYLDLDGRAKCHGILKDSYKYLYDNYLASGISQFNYYINNQENDKAYESLKMATDYLVQKSEYNDYYTPNLDSIYLTLHRLWNNTNRYIEARTEAFEYDMNYYSFRQETSAIQNTFSDYQKLLLSSIHIDEYYDQLISFYQEDDGGNRLQLITSNVNALRQKSRSYSHDEKQLESQINDQRNELLSSIRIQEDTLANKKKELNDLNSERERLERNNKKRTVRRNTGLIGSAIFSVASGTFLYLMLDSINTYDNANNTPDVVAARESAELWATLSVASAGTAGALGIFSATQGNKSNFMQQEEISKQIEKVNEEIRVVNETISILNQQLEMIEVN